MSLNLRANAPEVGRGQILDVQARRADRQRLRDLDLDVEIAEAEEWADPGRLDAARGAGRVVRSWPVSPASAGGQPVANGAAAWSELDPESSGQSGGVASMAWRRGVVLETPQELVDRPSFLLPIRLWATGSIRGPEAA